MDAIEFMKEKKRMCKSYSGCTDSCLLRKPMYENRLTCLGYCFKYPEKAVEIVEKWSAEHPAKTRQSEFLKVFPMAEMNEDVVGILPCAIDSSVRSERCKKYEVCSECRKEYWLSEID